MRERPNPQPRLAASRVVSNLTALMLAGLRSKGQGEPTQGNVGKCRLGARRRPQGWREKRRARRKAARASRRRNRRRR